jgi:N-acetylmuramoyl-L-alanine amidase
MLSLMLALTVVIDPGHGGSNTGAPGRAPGAFEKQVTLRIARALERRLKSDGAEVVLTRDRDRYLTIRERSRRSNAARPDCFISLHTNATLEHGRRGVETYVLERQAVDVEAHRAAFAAADPLTARLADLGRLDAQHQSLALAKAVQTRLVAIRPGADRGVKQAELDVLEGVEAPAILVEVGFIDHPLEGAELLREDVVERIAQALADGIEEFAQHKLPPKLANAAP